VKCRPEWTNSHPGTHWIDVRFHLSNLSH
jgi:hypothetical protein